jgi:DNA-binding transcriptional MerR regulator
MSEPGRGPLGHGRRERERTGSSARPAGPDAPLPAKLYYRIGEVSELVGVEPHVLRYWEREFRTIRPAKSAKGQRVYSRRDVESLLRVRELLYGQGFTIAGAKKKLGAASGGEPAPDQSAGEQASNQAGIEPAPDSEAAERRRACARLLDIRADIEAFLAELGR